MKKLKVGTRKSQLALWQAYYVKDALERCHDGISIELVEIISEGDKTLDTPLYESGGKGLFLKELETALLESDIDLAVHSMKDVPVFNPAGLIIPVACEREDPRDAFVSNKFERLEILPAGARIGTCSLRRKSQIAAYRPDLEWVNLRGNVNTRLAKLDAGEFDAIILACAGLIRLEMKHRIAQPLSVDISLPAVGQGIVGIQCREDDKEVQAIIAPLNNHLAQTQIRAEREVNRILEGGCHAPLGSYCVQSADSIWLRAMVGNIDGSIVLRSDAEGSAAAPEALGQIVAQGLLDQGAKAIIESHH